jgi:hypothetical protein
LIGRLVELVRSGILLFLEDEGLLDVPRATTRSFCAGA